MIHHNESIYPRDFTSQEKCRLWIELGLASEQEFDVLRELMDKYQPTTAKENKLVFLNLLYRAGEYTETEYHKILKDMEQD